MQSDGSVHLQGQAGNFPSQGIEVTRDGTTTGTLVVNDASCIPSAKVLGGLPAAANVLFGLLTSHSFDVTADAGQSVSIPSRLCS